MKRLSRHTVVVLLIALLSSMGGMTLAVVAFGQSGGNPDATVPTGGYTATTPAPLSPYSTTPTTTPSSTSTTPTPTTKTSTTPTEATTTNGSNPVRKHGTTPVPSRVTRNGPTHLAFTGGEPIYVGFFGLSLMLGGLMLHRRRRAHVDHR